MTVDDGYEGNVHGAVRFMNPSGEIYVLAIEEEAFVEKPNLAEGVGAEKHERTLMAGNVELHGMIYIAQLIVIKTAAGRRRTVYWSSPWGFTMRG